MEKKEKDFPDSKEFEKNFKGGGLLIMGDQQLINYKNMMLNECRYKRKNSPEKNYQEQDTQSPL
jgi:hypothetical protein